MVSRVQNFFIGLLGENEVPDSTSKLLWPHGITTTADKLYTRIPSTEALESFLTNKVRLLQGTDEGDGNYGREDRDLPDLVGARGLGPHLTAKIMSKWRQHFWYARHPPSGYHDPGIGAPLREQCECRRGGLDRQCNRPSRRESNGLHTCLACTFRRCACLCDECMAEVVAVTPQYFNTTEPDQKKKKKR